ncbi:hypothetical protein M1523_03555 [Patescibacteria group bacterium]|nr:hypothetical protein [Patescibacteria group bacterium]MCL5092027.1 hypothetical protein [Patescibacteria group bacterium]
MSTERHNQSSNDHPPVPNDENRTTVNQILKTILHGWNFDLFTGIDRPVTGSFYYKDTIYPCSISSRRPRLRRSNKHQWEIRIGPANCIMSAGPGSHLIDIPDLPKQYIPVAIDHLAVDPVKRGQGFGTLTAQTLEVLLTQYAHITNTPVVVFCEDDSDTGWTQRIAHRYKATSLSADWLDTSPIARLVNINPGFYKIYQPKVHRR